MQFYNMGTKTSSTVFVLLSTVLIDKTGPFSAISREWLHKNKEIKFSLGS
jgi:hypothetical protein